MAAEEKMLHASEQERADVVAARTAWRAEVCAGVDAARLVFLDESGVDTAMTPLYARAPRGQRALGRAPGGHWKRLTILGALAADGLVAAMTVAAATTTQVFAAFVEQVLLPALRDRPGCLVVMDNLAPHKAACVRAAFEAAGISYRYLPPYSPDLNPIEPVWSKLKGALRRAEARSLDQLDAELPRALDQITPSDAQGWFRHAGYRSN
jgi:transposase